MQHVVIFLTQFKSLISEEILYTRLLVNSSTPTTFMYKEIVYFSQIEGKKQGPNHATLRIIYVRSTLDSFSIKSLCTNFCPKAKLLTVTSYFDICFSAGGLCPIPGCIGTHLSKNYTINLIWLLSFLHRQDTSLLSLSFFAVVSTVSYLFISRVKKKLKNLGVKAR